MTPCQSRFCVWFYTAKRVPHPKTWLRVAALCGSRVIRVRETRKGIKQIEINKSTVFVSKGSAPAYHWQAPRRAPRVACPCSSVPWHVGYAAHGPCPVEYECRLQQCDWPGVCQVPHNLISVKLRAFFADVAAAASAPKLTLKRAKTQKQNKSQRHSDTPILYSSYICDWIQFNRVIHFALLTHLPTDWDETLERRK